MEHNTTNAMVMFSTTFINNVATTLKNYFKELKRTTLNNVATTF
jgi:hypothetical protein